MKKYVPAVTTVFMIFVLLASCGKSAVESVNIKAIYQKITENVVMPAETLELIADDLAAYYGIDTAKVADVAAVQDACGYKDEIVIIKAVDDTAAKEIGALLSEHIEYQKDSMRNYDPEQYNILCSSKVIVNGSYAAMFISAEQSAMSEIFNGFFK